MLYTGLDFCASNIVHLTRGTSVLHRLWPKGCLHQQDHMITGRTGPVIPVDLGAQSTFWLQKLAKSSTRILDPACTSILPRDRLDTCHQNIKMGPETQFIISHLITQQKSELYYQNTKIARAVYTYPTDAQRSGPDTVRIVLILLLAYTPKAKHVTPHPT
jgi:hypothetical protein